MKRFVVLAIELVLLLVSVSPSVSAKLPVRLSRVSLTPTTTGSPSNIMVDVNNRFEQLEIEEESLISPSIETLTATVSLSKSVVFLPIIINQAIDDNVNSPSASEIREDSTTTIGQILQPEVGTKVTSASENDIGSSQLAPPLPGMEIYQAQPDGIKTEDKSASISAAGWNTIMNEGFEGLFPSGSWRTFDNDGSTNGEYYWDDDDYKPYSGSWSAWVANGGANALDPQYYYYPNYAKSWMVYGPFDLSNATDAELLFYYWNRSELNYDYFGWYASANGTNFYGTRVSGDSGGWRYVNFDLTSVPGLGNLAGDSSVWIAFVSTSDFSIVNNGSFVDNIVLQKYINTSTCPNQYKAEYYNNRYLSGNPTFTQCENWPIIKDWGGGGPGNGVGNDNFSVRWTGTAYISAGTYTFLAAADDGIRVWLDNSLILDAWRDQAPTSYRTNRTVSSGNHSVKVEYYENGGGALAQFGWSPAVPNGVPGITYSTRNEFHVFKVDLWSANLSYETVMASDRTSVNYGKPSASPREFVRNMVARAPYVSRNPVLAFNADVFGDNNNGTGNHGPEGLTIKNGSRFDGQYANPPEADTDGNEWKRSSLSISSSKTVRIGKLTDCNGPAGGCYAWQPTSTYYNTVGGIPLFIDNGVRIGGSGVNSTQPCRNEAPDGSRDSYCTNSFKWTAAGVTRNGRYLIVVVSNVNKSMDQAAAVLIAEGAWKAIKLDGGSSTQVWYKSANPQSIIGGGRPVANAIVVYN